MRLDRLPGRARLGLYAVAVTVLLYLCLAPSTALPEVNIWDKAEHAVAWLVLTGAGLVLFPTRPGRIAAFAFLFGGLIELLQGALPVGRDADWKDWVADTVGLLAALAIYALSRRRKTT